MAPDMQAKDLAFSCPTTHGIVPPGEKKCVSVFFCPETLNIRTTDYLSIVPSGCASQTLLKLVGFCRGTGNCRTLHRPWGQEQPTPRPGKYSPPVPKGQTPHCPSAWVSAAPWWLMGESLQTPGENAPALGPGGLLRLLGLQAFPTQPSVSKQQPLPSVGTFLRHPRGNGYPGPNQVAEPTHKNPINFAQVLVCPCSTTVSTSAGSTSGSTQRSPSGLRTSQTAQRTSSLPLTARRASSASDLPLGPWWARPA